MVVLFILIQSVGDEFVILLKLSLSCFGLFELCCGGFVVEVFGGDGVLVCVGV